MGGNAFCFKVCDPSNEHAADYCQHIYDRIGCAYNAPNNAQDKVFESCEGDLQDFPGVYTGSDGQVTTYTQPPESLGEITSIPYTPTVVASSNCQTYASSALFTELAAATGVTSAASGSATASGSAAASSGSAAASSGTAKGSSSAAASRSGSATGSSASASASAAGSTSNTSGAASRSEGLISLFFSLAAGLFGVGAAISLLA